MDILVKWFLKLYLLPDSATDSLFTLQPKEWTNFDIIWMCIFPGFFNFVGICHKTIIHNLLLY